MGLEMIKPAERHLSQSIQTFVHTQHIVIVNIAGCEVFGDLHVDFFAQRCLGNSIGVISLYGSPIQDNHNDQNKVNCCPMETGEYDLKTSTLWTHLSPQTCKCAFNL